MLVYGYQETENIRRIGNVILSGVQIIDGGQ